MFEVVKVSLMKYGSSAFKVSFKRDELNHSEIMSAINFKVMIIIVTLE